MIAALFASTAFATTFARPSELAELAARSDYALAGKVVSTEGVIRSGRIWTLARIDADDDGPDMDVWTLGGCVPEQNLCMTVAGSPEPKTGDDVVVFLTEGRVTGLAQGWFRVRDGVGVRDLSGLTFADGAAPPARIDVSELRGAIVAARAPKN